MSSVNSYCLTPNADKELKWLVMQYFAKSVAALEFKGLRMKKKTLASNMKLRASHLAKFLKVISCTTMVNLKKTFL